MVRICVECFFFGTLDALIGVRLALILFYFTSLFLFVFLCVSVCVVRPEIFERRKGGKRTKMSKSCKGLVMELVKCLSESDCIKVENRSFRECAGEKSPSIPSECVGLRETYFNCKRGQVDMRARIRGNKGY